MHIFRDVGRVIVLILGLQLIPSSASPAQTTAPQYLDLSKVKSLYSGGQYVEVADTLTPYLKSNPTDSKARAVLVLALLKLGESSLAKTQVDILLSSNSDSQGSALGLQLKKLIDIESEQKETREGIYRALSQYDASEASRLIDKLAVSQEHRQVMQAYVNIYQADFSAAHSRLAKLAPESLADTRAIRQLDQQITDDSAASTKLKGDIESYLYSEITSNVCNSFLMTPKAYAQKSKGEPSINSADFQHYVENVIKLNTLTPLDPYVMDAVFHVTLLGSSYDAIQRVGDRIIATKGDIRIPFLSKDKYFWVVIDGKHGRISTLPNSVNKLQVYYDYPALLPTDYTPLVLFHAAKASKHSPVARWYEDEVPFDIPFNQLTQIDQKAKDWRGGLEAKSYALKMTPVGMAPNYLLMNVLACTFGEEAQRRATRSLGLYIEHVAKPQPIQLKLVDPSKHTVDVWGEGGLGSMVAGMYSSTAAQYGTATDVALASIVSQQMSVEEADKKKYDQSQQVLSHAWFAEMRAISETFHENRNMTEVEKLLGL